MKYLHKYFNTFRGLSKEIWYLSIVTLVNRAGTMIIPFLALYLEEGLDFTKPQIGWVWSAFGLGSFCGSWLGGRLTDKIGYYPVMVVSLIATGLLFMALQLLHGFWPFCVGIFLIMIVADTFRPASFAAINTYSKPENKTRSITIIRLAINLGMGLGPLLAGLIIDNIGYLSIFWIDGITCVAGGILIILILKPKEKRDNLSDKLETTTINNKERLSHLLPYKDKAYLLYLFILFLSGFIFMQIFSLLPLYYDEVHLLSKTAIGWLLFLNGMLIVFTEMPIVDYFERKKIAKLTIIQYAIVLLGGSYLVLIFDAWVGVLIIGMVLITYGEMLAFPFSNAYAMNWGLKKYIGEYLGWYTMTFSLSSMIGPNLGVQVANKFGYDVTWCLLGFIGLTGILLTQYLKKILEMRKLNQI